MTTLLVVRHGQASFGTCNYDVLSPLGIKQSRRLGTWLARMAFRPDAIWCGPLQRQIDTARYLISAAVDEGLHLPEPEILDDLRELPAHDLAKHVLPDLDRQSDDKHLQSASHGRWASPTEDAPVPAFEWVLDEWANGRIDADDIETFAAFETRVRRAFEHVIDRTDKDCCTVVVTSAGPLAVAMRAALNLDRTLTMKLGGVSANSGITDFRVRDRHLKLVAFNSVGHLERDEVTRI